MKRLRAPRPERRSRRGFSLVEAVLSLGIMSFGFLALAPLMAVGLSGARCAQENRTMAQIAATYIERAKQGALIQGTTYLDSDIAPCPAELAVYTVQNTMTSCNAAGVFPGAPLTRLVLRISPRCAPKTVRTYADVFPSPAP